MKIFPNYSKEEFRIYNPAYCGYLLYCAIFEYQTLKKKGMPSSMVYLILPIVMTKFIASSLPKTSKTSIMNWVNNNQVCFADFDTKASDFFEITQEAIEFLLELEAVLIDANGLIHLNTDKITRNTTIYKKSNNTKSHLPHSKILGKWFATCTPSTLYSILGIKP